MSFLKTNIPELEKCQSQLCQFCIWKLFVRISLFYGLLNCTWTPSCLLYFQVCSKVVSVVLTAQIHCYMCQQASLKRKVETDLNCFRSTSRAYVTGEASQLLMGSFPSVSNKHNQTVQQEVKGTLGFFSYYLQVTMEVAQPNK